MNGHISFLLLCGKLLQDEVALNNNVYYLTFRGQDRDWGFSKGGVLICRIRSGLPPDSPLRLLD